MRERLVGYLEKGGRCLHRSMPTQPYRGQRLLHSAFWSHGAGDIDLPSWWIALLQLPQAQNERDLEKENLGPRFFEFLYPSQTLAFIRTYTSADPTVIKRYQRLRKYHQGSREYVSSATDGVEGLHGSTMVESKIAEEERIKQCTREVAPTDAIRREDLLVRLDELLLRDDPGSQHLHLWQVYQELRGMSVTLLPRQLVRMMRCFSRSGANIDQERLLELVSSVPVKERRSIHYSYAVSAALRLDKLALAVHLHKEALVRSKRFIGTSALLQYTTGRNFWQVAIETWQNSVKQEGTSEDLPVWDNISAFPLTELWLRASSALDFALQIKDLAGEHAASTARDFALQITLQTLLLKGADMAGVDEAEDLLGSRSKNGSDIKRDGSTFLARLRPHVNRHEEMINKAIDLKASAKELYTAAISQVLIFATRGFDALALKYYRALRELIDEIPSRATVIAMLRRLCSIQSSAGIFMVLNDYRFYYGDVPTYLLELVIPVLAHKGNRQAVDDLLREYQSAVPVIVHSRVANALLYACNRRGETQKLPEMFHALQRDFNFEPDRRSWNTVIASYARVGDIDEASKWFNAFLDSDIKPDKRTFIYMMSMFAKRGDLDAVRQLLRQSADLGVPTDIGMIDCLVLAQIHNGELQNAETLVEEALNTVEDVPMSSRTRMWNYLLNAYALRADLEKVTVIHRRMRESNVPSDGTTFAALIQCLVVCLRLRGALKILTEIMPEAEVPPTALHYGILMSGYLRKKQYWKVFKLYSQMLEKDLKPTMGTRNYIVRAAAMSDEGERTETGGSDDQAQYTRAQAAIEQTMVDMNPMDLATSEPVQFVGNLRLDDAFSSSYFAYMVYIYGRSRALEKAAEMYDQYIEKRREFDMNVDTSAPIRMLSALMLTSRNAKDHETVQKCWQLSLGKAQTLARRKDASTSEPGWVLPARRYILNTHLRYYVDSLVAQQRFGDIDKTIDHLLHCGYALDSRSWNQYIVVLVQNQQSLKAFTLCERELMPGWEGWDRLGHFSGEIQRRTQRRQARHLDPHLRHPQYHTMVYLAAAFVGAQSVPRDRWGVTAIERLSKAAPRTVKAVYNLPRLNDLLQGTLLKEI